MSPPPPIVHFFFLVCQARFQPRSLLKVGLGNFFSSSHQATPFVAIATSSSSGHGSLKLVFTLQKHFFFLIYRHINTWTIWISSLSSPCITLRLHYILFVGQWSRTLFFFGQWTGLISNIVFIDPMVQSIFNNKKKECVFFMQIIFQAN